MAKPIISGITTFDANLVYSFSIRWTGSVSSNRIVVYETSTNELVYSSANAVGLTAVIPANILSNGKKYYVGAYVTDGDGVESEISDYVFFTCFSTPTLTFSNISDSTINIKGGSVTGNIQYSQAEGRALSTFRFFLTNTSGKIVMQSPAMYSGDELTYTFRGMTGGNTYILYATGTTVDNVQCETAKITVNVAEPSKADYSLLTLENDSANGYIKYTSHLTFVDCDNSDGVEISGGVADVEGKTLAYTTGFKVEGDFTLRLGVADGSALSPNETFLELRSNSDTVKINYAYVNDTNNIKFRLSVSCIGSPYIIYSETYPATILESDFVVAIRREGNLYELYVSQGE